MITPYDYHTEEDKHGSYQYVALKAIVNDLEFEFSDDNHYLKSVKRSRILYWSKEAIRKFNKQVFDDVRAAEITVPENLTLALPHNFVDYVRVSVVVEDPATESYRLKPLNINTEMNIADGYLQDHDAEILFDEDGGILMADASNVYNKPYKKYHFDSNPIGKQFEKDTSKLSKFGEFTIDKRHGKIAFSSDLYDKEIVIEYVSDGLEFDTYNDEVIKVHKNLISLVKDWVYYALIKATRVSQSEKKRALDRYKTELHQAKLDNANFDFIQIARVLRISSKR